MPSWQDLTAVPSCPFASKGKSFPSLHTCSYASRPLHFLFAQEPVTIVVWCPWPGDGKKMEGFFGSFSPLLLLPCLPSYLHHPLTSFSFLIGKERLSVAPQGLRGKIHVSFITGFCFFFLMSREVAARMHARSNQWTRKTLIVSHFYCRVARKVDPYYHACFSLSLTPTSFRGLVILLSFGIFPWLFLKKHFTLSSSFLPYSPKTANRTAGQAPSALCSGM